MDLNANIKDAFTPRLFEFIIEQLTRPIRKNANVRRKVVGAVEATRITTVLVWLHFSIELKMTPELN